VSLFYRYNPQTVAAVGVTFLEFGPDGLATWTADRLCTWYEQEAGRPQLRFSPFMSISGKLDGLTIIGTSTSGETVTLTHRGDGPALELSEDDGRIAYRTTPNDIRLFFDRGVIELFTNGGLICGARRSYRVVDLASLWTSAESGASIRVWEYRSAWRPD